MALQRKRSSENWLKALVPLAALTAAAWSYIDTKQREIIFAPDKQESMATAEVELSYQEKWIPHSPANAAAYPAALHAWWAPAKQADAPVVLYLHGARRNLTGHANRISLWHQMGFSVLAIDYRGFGKSAGDLPTETSVYEDAQTAWNYLKRLAPQAQARFAYGHSLGGAIAIELATKNPDIGGLIVESTFTSIREMAQVMAYRWLPVKPILTQHFDSLSKVSSLNAPTLFMHGTADEVVPHEMSGRLYDATPEPKRLALFTDAGHSDVSWKAFRQYRTTVHQFVDTVVAAKAY